MKENNLSRLDNLINDLEQFFRVIYSQVGKARTWVDHHAHLVAGRSLIRVSTSTSRELDDRTDLYVKVPEADNQVDRLENIDDIYYISHRQYRFNNSIEVIRLDGRLLYKFMTEINTVEKDIYTSYGIKEQRGYRLFPLRSILISKLLKGYYVIDYRSHTYMDMIDVSTHPLLPRDVPLFFKKFKLRLVPPRKKIQIIRLSDGIVWDFESITDAAIAFHVPIEAISKTLRCKQKSFKNKSLTAVYKI